MNLPCITKIMWDLSSFSALKVMIMTPTEKKRDKPQRQACVFICFYQGKKPGDETWKLHVVEISTVNAWGKVYH